MKQHHLTHQTISNGGKDMRKIYTEPELEIREYKMSMDSVTTSDPVVDLNKDDQVDYFDNNN